MSNYEAVKKCQEKRYSMGLCKRCGKNPYEPGKTMCKNCLTYAKRRMLDLKKERRELGLCITCGAFVDSPRYTQCKNCREKATQRARDKRQNNRMAMSGM